MLSLGSSSCPYLLILADPRQLPRNDLLAIPNNFMVLWAIAAFVACLSTAGAKCNVNTHECTFEDGDMNDPSWSRKCYLADDTCCCCDDGYYRISAPDSVMQTHGLACRPNLYAARASTSSAIPVSAVTPSPSASSANCGQNSHKCSSESCCCDYGYREYYVGRCLPDIDKITTTSRLPDIDEIRARAGQVTPAPDCSYGFASNELHRRRRTCASAKPAPSTQSSSESGSSSAATVGGVVAGICCLCGMWCCYKCACVKQDENKVHPASDMEVSPGPVAQFGPRAAAAEQQRPCGTHLQPASTTVGMRQAAHASWTRLYDANTRHYYYYDAATGQTSWQPPSQLG